MSIQVKPIYDCKRASRRQLFGIFVDGECVLITRVYPSWITSASH